jgi:hypothetical protein
MSQIMESYHLISSEQVPPSISSSPVSVEEVSWFIDRIPDYNYSMYLQLQDEDINNYYSPGPTEMTENTGHHRPHTPDTPPPPTANKFYISVVFQNLEISEEQQNCCICMENREKNEICELNCQHNFCGTCIKDVLCKNKNSKQPNCPLCRRDIKNIKTQQTKIKDILMENCIPLI